MVLKSIKNNIFLYLLSLSNSINYIFYFPFILFYLLETEKLEFIDSIKIYIFFIIYDLIRNIFMSFINKTSNCLGLNRKITLDLIILTLINISLFYLFFKFKDKIFLFNAIIIFRIIFSLTNVSSLFISKITENIFTIKERFSKLNIFDFYEKLNNFLIFVIIFFFINEFDKLYLYFFYSSIFNLFFSILFIIMFKCYDEKKYALYEDQNINKIKTLQMIKSQINKINIKLNKKQNIRGVYRLEEDNFSKSNNKDLFRAKYRKNSSEMITNSNLVKNKFNGSENKNISENENNDIILNTNNNQIITNAENLRNNNEKSDNNYKYKNKDLYANNFIPIGSSKRNLNENKNSSFIEIKNENISNKKKWIFILLILIPIKFLKYLFLIMLFFKTYSLRKVFDTKIHLIFYIWYFFMNILIYPLNRKVFSKIIKIKIGKRIVYILSIILSIPSCIGYIYLIMDNKITNIKLQLMKYIIFFVLNFILKEVLYILLRINYINSISVGFSKKIFNDMKEISNILTCIIFLLYNILLLYIYPDSITHKIIKIACYFFLPVFFLLIFFINTIKISF